MGGAGAGAAAGGVLAAELCAPLLLLCWLCCWNDDASSDSASGKHPQRPVLAHVHESGSRRRSSDMFGRRIGSSAVSLHLPSTSGYKKPLSAHRSHEEIVRRKSNHDSSELDARYHSAPSVIDEVIHRRDWERSSKDLYIPLKPQRERHSLSSESPEAPHATPESSSLDDKSDEHCASASTAPCKKHHSNIKSSRGKKENETTDIKDDDATEASNFYIGEGHDEEEIEHDLHAKSSVVYKAKDDKQSINESIRSREVPRVLLDEPHPRALGFCMDDVIEQLDRLEQLDRSGATHHTMESRASLAARPVFPPPSVEPVGYDGGACYLAEEGTLSELRSHACPAGSGGRGRALPGSALAGPGRPRFASDGDILAPTLRPESGAFSESDLDLELEEAEERPPPYEEVQHYAAHDRKETAI